MLDDAAADEDDDEDGAVDDYDDGDGGDTDDDGDDVEEGNDVCVLSLILARGGELCLLLQPLELQPACCPPLASNFPKNVCS